MSRKAAKFTEADINRAIKAAKRNGMEVALERDGTIRIVAERPVNKPGNPVEDLGVDSF